MQANMPDEPVTQHVVMIVYGTMFATPKHNSSESPKSCFCVTCIQLQNWQKSLRWHHASFGLLWKPSWTI